MRGAPCSDSVPGAVEAASGASGVRVGPGGLRGGAAAAAAQARVRDQVPQETPQPHHTGNQPATSMDLSVKTVSPNCPDVLKLRSMYMYVCMYYNSGCVKSTTIYEYICYYGYVFILQLVL